jgi:hypothetical protein
MPTNKIQIAIVFLGFQPYALVDAEAGVFLIYSLFKKKSISWICFQIRILSAVLDKI